MTQILLPHENEVYFVGGLMFQSAFFPEPMEVPLHGHDFAGLYLIRKGSLRETCRKETATFIPGTLSYRPIEETHALSIAQGTRLFQIGMSRAWLDRIRQYSPPLNAPGDFREGMPFGLARRLFHEFRCHTDCFPLMLEGLTLELLSAISDKPERLTVPRPPRWLRQTQELLRAHFTQNLSLDTIAATVGVHPSHLMRAFRQQYGCTVGEYVRRLRIEFACHLLITSDAPLFQVALDAGFADQSHFSRTFKALTGITPAAYKKTHGRASLRQE